MRRNSGHTQEKQGRRTSETERTEAKEGSATKRQRVEGTGVRKTGAPGQRTRKRKTRNTRKGNKTHGAEEGSTAKETKRRKHGDRKGGYTGTEGRQRY